jgi:osmoprotectant transport system ATP-binding protein
VARGLAVDPNILLMDEPFGAVDPLVRAELQQELVRLQRELDKTVVFVTHDIDEAFLLGDQVVIFKKGGIVAQIGTPDEILAEPADDFVARFVGADRGKRALHLRSEAGRELVVDGDGRAAGVLVDERTRDDSRGSGEKNDREGRATTALGSSDEAGAAATASGASAQGDRQP